MSRRNKRKLQRAYPGAGNPGGAIMTIPTGSHQPVYNQTFYGSQMHNLPVQNGALFSPGTPLNPIPGVNPDKLPIQWRFPIAFNTQPVDRSLGDPDVPSFQVLRNLARLYSGITLCERAWLDMVPRMSLKVGLKSIFVEQGADHKKYQKQIAYFMDFFSKPDGQHDIHSWLRMALREQTQIDELYLYKNRTRGGKLLGLSLVAGDQIKPLLDDWGHIPSPPLYAYQQYPWGIPGMMYSTEQIIHYQESPATDNPFGFSRVERIILEVNIALRKKRKDLARFTQGNVPQGIMEVPADLQWSPDQIDAYEQMWNSLLAGNASKQVQVKFTQPGMKYTQFQDFGSTEHVTEFDQFLLNIAVAAYGLSMQDLAFTGDIHKSSGDSQQNVTYRRTVDPLATIYAQILTECMNHDFPDDLQGALFDLSFGGYDEEEDLQSTVAAYSQAAGAGLIGITDATNALKFPQPKDAPYIGRVMLTKDGPIFLDDMATSKVRDAALQAKMATYEQTTQMAQGPAPGSASVPSPAPQAGTPPSGQSSDEEETSVDKAFDEAESSVAALARFDPVHGFHGEFGYDSSSQTAPSAKKTGAHTHKSKGTHAPKGPKLSLSERTQKRLNKLAARFAKLENRKLSKHWTQAQRDATMKLRILFSNLASAVAKGNQQDQIDTMLDHAWKEVSTLYAGKVSALAAMSKALSTIDVANDKGLFNRFVPIEWNEDEDDESIFDELEEALDTCDEDRDEAAWQKRGINEQRTSEYPESEETNHRHDAGTIGRGTTSDESTGTNVRPVETSAARLTQDAAADYRRWRERAVEDVKTGRHQRRFTSTIIPEAEQRYIKEELACCTTIDEVRYVFERAKAGAWRQPTAEQQRLEDEMKTALKSLHFAKGESPSQEDKERVARRLEAILKQARAIGQAHVREEA